MSKSIKVPCNGNGGNNKIPKTTDTIVFSTNGNCKFTGFNFVGTGNPYYPPGFSNKSPANGQGDTVSYDYDGSAIPAAGYEFSYSTDAQITEGNGTGTIKNT